MRLGYNNRRGDYYAEDTYRHDAEKARRRDRHDRFLYYRKRRGFTQEQLAERIGISRQHMAGIEAPNMLRPTSLEVIFNIATVLDIEPYMLLKFNPEK